MKGTLIRAGVTFPDRKWCAASGKALSEAAMSVMVKPIRMTRTSCGGPREGSCTEAALNASASFSESWKRDRQKV
ncbi:hypothetical protein D3C85_1578770 [compost metagenome]